MVQTRILLRWKGGFNKNHPSTSDVNWGYSEQDGMRGQGCNQLNCVSQNVYVEVLTPSHSECDCIWR